MDAAAAEARRRMGVRPGWWSVALVAIAVGSVAFFAGSRVARGPGGNAASLAAATDGSSHDGHDHAGESELWTCSMHPQVIQEKQGICPICHMELTPLKAGGDGGGTVTIDPVVVQNIGVRTAPATRGPLVQSVRAVGYLEEPEPMHRDINLRVNGWIETLHASIDGMVVARGQPLFELYSPELVVAIDELISARKQLDRMPEDASARSLVESGKRKLLQFGLEREQIDTLAALDTAPTTVPILAPMDGHLTEKKVYEGAAVRAGDLVMRLASRHRMWIDAQVHEQQMPLISDGQPVRATLISQPGQVFKGKVLFVHPHVDPQTRTALVRIEIDNEQLHLRQGMYATVTIAADSYREATLIPREAVIDTGRRQVAFVALGEGRFEPRELKLGLPGHDGTVEVVEGVGVGETVVTSAQFLLDTESRMKEAVAKHLSGGLTGHGAAGATGATTPASPATTQPAATLVVPHADEIVAAYLALQQQLGERQTDGMTPLDPSPLVSIASQAADHGSGEAQQLATTIADAARALAGQSLADQRRGFVPLSNAMIELARRGRLSVGAAPTLYVAHCPMAFDDAGAHWLQVGDDIANPYYATQMKRCGEVVEQIPLQP
jgi:RND family efflux transporter MFP subunit